MNLKEAPDFQIFSRSLLFPLTARWKDGVFTIKRHGKAIMVLLPDDAHEMIDALHKFVAVNQ